MTRVSLLFALVFAFITGAAWAIYGQPVQIIGEGADEIPVQSISFITTDGTQIPVEDDGDDDDGAFLILFPGDNSTGGRLIISLPGGDRIIQVPPVGPGQDLIIDLDTGMAYPDDGRPALPGSETPASPTVLIGYTGVTLNDIPMTGFGTLVESGGEAPLAELDDDIYMDGFDLDMGIPIPGGFGDYVFGRVSRYSGSDSADGSFASSGGDVAIAYQDFSPTDATGVFLGAAGLDSLIERDMDVFSVKGGLGWEYPFGDGPGTLRPYVFLDYLRIETDIFARVTTPTYSDIYQETRQTIEQDYTAIGVGTTYAYQFGDWVIGGAGVNAYAYSTDAQFTSEQMNVCGLCGAGNNFTSVVTGDADETGFGAGAQLFLEAILSPRFSIRGEVSFQEASGLFGLDTPISGNDLYIDNDPVDFAPARTVSAQRFFLGGRLRF